MKRFINIVIVIGIGIIIFDAVFASVLFGLLFVSKFIFEDVLKTDESIFLLVAPIVTIVSVLAGIGGAIFAGISLWRFLNKPVPPKKGVYYSLIVVSLSAIAYMVYQYASVANPEQIRLKSIRDKNPNICDQISREKNLPEREACYLAAFEQLTTADDCNDVHDSTMESRCYEYFAIREKNISLCNNVLPQSDPPAYCKDCTSKLQCGETVCNIVGIQEPRCQKEFDFDSLFEEW